MMETTLQKEAWQCDWCGDLRGRDDVVRVSNPKLHEKDVLIFCKDRDCRTLYEVCDAEDDHHRVCPKCNTLVSTAMQPYAVRNGLTYHFQCWMDERTSG